MKDEDFQTAVRVQIKALLAGGQAHVTFDDAVSGLPLDTQGQVPASLPYSPWQLLEHLRIAQRDILDFSANDRRTYKAMAWPDDYWPKVAAPSTSTAWAASVDAIREDRAAFERLLEIGDLTAPFPWGDGQNLLRQALLIAAHESYHLGELVVTRRLLDAWKPKEGHA